MMLSIGPRGVKVVGVVELRKLLIKHVLSDAADDHVQELAATEVAPTAGDLLARVINEDNLGETGGVSRPHKTRSKAPAAPVDHPAS